MDNALSVHVTNRIEDSTYKKFNIEFMFIYQFSKGSRIRVVFELSNLQFPIEMVLIEIFHKGEEILCNCQYSNSCIWEACLLMLWYTSIFYSKLLKIVQNLFELVTTWLTQGDFQTPLHLKYFHDNL